MSATDERPLPEAVRELSQRYGGGVPYQRVWGLVISGAIPATKRGRGWHINRAHNPQIAEPLGLTSPRPNAA